jgi:tetratricopeptide (TPR) repeat protein
MKDIETTYLKALEYATTGEIESAKKLIGQILQVDPLFGKAHYLMGWICFEHNNDHEGAINHAKNAMENDPRNPLGYYLYCDILIANHGLEEIKSILDGMVQLNVVDKAYVYQKLAYAYETRREYTNAIYALGKSKEFDASIKWDTFIDREITRLRGKANNLVTSRW